MKLVHHVGPHVFYSRNDSHNVGQFVRASLPAFRWISREKGATMGSILQKGECACNAPD